MAKKVEFRIKYYDYDDSELYTIIQVAPNESLALKKAKERISKSTENYKIVYVEDINTPNFYIREIRRILYTDNRERTESNWGKRKRKTMA